MILDDVLFQTIVTRYKNSVYRQALWILGDVDEAKDATQDVFLKVYEGIHELRIEDGLWNWIHRTTVNTCLSRCREEAAEELESLDDVDKNLPDAEQDLENAYVDGELKRMLVRFMPRLPANQATALSLFYYENKSIEEIAAIMNTEYNTAASYIHRGRNKLHTLLVRTFQEDLR